ncbi:MAG: hypothetical protein ABFQ62_04640 [Patescibacteria group bacterium]
MAGKTQEGLNIGCWELTIIPVLIAIVLVNSAYFGISPVGVVDGFLDAEPQDLLEDFACFALFVAVVFMVKEYVTHKN